MPRKLIFVYNADSGLFNTVSDIAHKILSPRTYACQLCALTHGYFSIREEWVEFLQELDADCTFMHRNEFKNAYPQQPLELPAVYIENEKGGLDILMDRQSIEACNNLGHLKRILQERLQRLNSHDI